MTPSQKTLNPDEMAEAVASLCELLSLTPEQAEAIINKKKKPVFKVVKKKKELHPYLITKENKCTLCYTKTTTHFLMLPNTDHTALISTPITPTYPGIKNYKEQITMCVVNSCAHCEENLNLLEKEDITLMFLEYINRREYVTF